MVFAICVFSMVIAQTAVRPVRRLEEGTRKIGSGDYEVNIPVTARDEIGDLTAAFNEMSRSLAIKEELLNEQRRENDRLLLALMPESVVQRYREGEENIAQKHQNVAIIYADIFGLDEMSNEMPEHELVGTIDELFRQFDSAAESFGVERIRTFHNGYLASCGVVTPRLDSIHRSVDFALEIGQRRERVGGPLQPRLRHVGRRGQSSLPNAQRLTAARHLRQLARIRSDAGVPEIRSRRHDLGRRYR
jgi:class 3 adenylate cyclase